MIYISGMEGGSGCGEAASRKAGWLRTAVPGGAVLRGAAQSAAAQLLDALNSALANRNRAASPSAPPPAPQRAGARAYPAPESRPRRPEFTPDGRPLPPDGSSPPPRATPTSGDQRPARTTAIGTATPAPPPVEFDASGRPLPPDGSAPPPRPRRETGSIPPGAHVGQATGSNPARSAGRSGATARSATPSRARGAPLPPGAAPAAPAGHQFVSRPVPAPPGEFLFDVRCSCGASVLAPVKLDDLRRAAAGGLSPAAAIAIATQDALDAMHTSR